MCDATNLYVWDDPAMRVSCPAPDLIHDRDMTHIRVTCLICVFDMTHAYVWHDAFEWVTCLFHMQDMTQEHLPRGPYNRVTCFIHTWGMTHSNVGHDSFKCVAWFMQMCGMTHADVRHASDAPATHVHATQPMPCPIHMCEMSLHMCGTTHSYGWHDSCICVMQLVVWHEAFVRVTWLIHMWDMTREHLPHGNRAHV